MTPTLDWLHQAEKHIRHLLEELRPQLLEAQGNIEHKLKDDKTIVTELDVLVENKLEETLRAFDPSIPFCGEESGADFEQQTFWLVDPIDGTEPFTRGLPFATNMVALISNGKPVLGIINNIALGDYYLAIEGQGATCNGHAIHVSDRPLERSFIVMGSTRSDLQEMLKNKVANTVKMSAPGYELSVLASGAIEARVAYHGRAKPWDFAPGALIVQEAGGRVANIGSDTYDYRNTNLIAANPVVFDELMQAVASLPDISLATQI